MMGGGTYITHADIETLVGMSLSTSSTPVTDAQVDAWCIMAEGLAAAEIYPNTLAGISDTAGLKAVLQQIVLRIWNRAKWLQNAGGALSGGSESYGDLEIITPSIRAQLWRLVAASTSTASLHDND